MNNKLLRQIAEQNKAISIQNNELMKRIDWNRNTNVPKELEWLTDEEYIPNESSESSEDTGVESDESLSTIDLCTSPESPQSQTNLPYNFRPRKSIANKEPNETLEQFVSYFKRSKSKSKLKNKKLVIKRNGEKRNENIEGLFIQLRSRHKCVALKRAVFASRVYFEDVYLVTAFVPSETACFANSPGKRSRTACANREASAAILSKISFTKEFIIDIAFDEIPVSG
ncbi:hypothetical protein B4U80_02170 [Leptotrombidium deliense]|uniref:Uncharacterized protein n=1 Tax=Leptotrombidium deliense TaxID=299467 RepID=A0A443SR75_9ACAR|nr:hypothetical protein B4U80_02170 [Leptotrombidium deliense]